MKYFCPFHDKWFPRFNEDDFNYGRFIYGNIRVDPIGDTIINRWNTVPVPAAPELKSAAVTSKNSALLILDMETTICKNPSCTSTIPYIYNLLNKARQIGMLVIYSVIPSGNPADIAQQLAPLPNELIVESGVDKFYDTNLNTVLREKGIKTVIVTGYAANGAVLHTGIGAAIRGYKVIVPVDCMSADIPYAEQYTAWHMVNSPGARNKVALSQTNLIRFLKL
ncbi:MAG: isochorismatase [Clostridiaceae bacterium]|nr:isochorismatase [Clostridiaceae bacterium]